MKKTLARVLALTLVLTLILASAVTAVAAEKPGIQVQYNGKNIAFTDAVPKIVDGRTMVPFRQILETMGAEVSYDNATKTVTAKTDEMELKFAVGSKDINVIQNGTTIVKKTAPGTVMEIKEPAGPWLAQDSWRKPWAMPSAGMLPIKRQ